VTAGIQRYDQNIDIPSLQRNWPDGRDIPQIIIDIATLLKSQIWGSVGYFSMKGYRFNDYWIEGGADLCEQFGMFLEFADGTQVAQWFHPGAVPGAEPIVEIGSEGDLGILAPNLHSFLRSWANDGGYRELTLADEDHTPERLAQWQVVAAQMHAIIDAAPKPPPGGPIDDVSAFIQSYGAASLQAMQSNPIHQEIAKVMDAHIPRGKESYEYYNAQIYIAGSRIEILPNALPPEYQVRAPLPEREALIPLILKIREQRSQGIHAARGLWHCACLRILPDGRVWIPADWETEPSFETGGRMTRAELEADLARFPRSDRWHMPWMDELT
jgi:hypothetical protein